MGSNHTFVENIDWFKTDYKLFYYLYWIIVWVWVIIKIKMVKLVVIQISLKDIFQHQKSKMFQEPCLFVCYLVRFEIKPHLLSRPKLHFNCTVVIWYRSLNTDAAISSHFRQVFIKHYPQGRKLPIYNKIDNITLFWNWCVFKMCQKH